MASILTTWDPSRAAHYSITPDNLTITSTVTDQTIQHTVVDLSALDTYQFSVILNASAPGSVVQSIGLTTDLETGTLGSSASLAFTSDGNLIINGAVSVGVFGGFGQTGDVLTVAIQKSVNKAFIIVNGTASGPFDVSTVFRLSYRNLYFAYSPNDAVTFSLSPYIFGTVSGGYVDVIALQPIVPVYTTVDPTVFQSTYTSSDNITISSSGASTQILPLLVPFNATSGNYYFSIKIDSVSNPLNGFSIGIVNGTHGPDFTQPGSAGFLSDGTVYDNGGDVTPVVTQPFGQAGDIVTFAIDTFGQYMWLNVNNTGWTGGGKPGIDQGLQCGDLFGLGDYMNLAFTMSDTSTVTIQPLINSPLSSFTSFLGSVPKSFLTSFERFENQTLSNNGNTVTLGSTEVDQKVAGYIPSTGKYVFSFSIDSNPLAKKVYTGFELNLHKLQSLISYSGSYTDTNGEVFPEPTYTFGTTGDVVTIAIDNVNRLIWWNVNNGGWTNSGNPDEGAGGISTVATITGTDFIQFFIQSSLATFSILPSPQVSLTTFTPVVVVPIALTINSVTLNEVHFSWSPYTTDTYSILLDDIITDSGIKGNTYSISNLVPSTTYSLQVTDTTSNVYSDSVSFSTLSAPIPQVTVTSVSDTRVTFTWAPYTSDTYSVILDDYAVQSALTGNTSSISYLTPETTYNLKVHDVTYDTYSTQVSFTTLPSAAPPVRIVTSTTNGQFIISADLLPAYSTYPRMIALENMRIVYKTSANPIESFIIHIGELNHDVLTFPYQSAITNYNAVIQSNTIGSVLTEPYTYPNISIYIQSISSIDGQRHEVNNTYQCTASFILYNYQA